MSECVISLSSLGNDGIDAPNGVLIFDDKVCQQGHTSQYHNRKQYILDGFLMTLLNHNDNTTSAIMLPNIKANIV